MQIQSFGHRKERVGTVVSTKMDKTISVAVQRTIPHALYKKARKSTKKYKAHDAENTCQEGDLVRIRETRPLSKSKRWMLVEVLERAK